MKQRIAQIVFWLAWFVALAYLSVSVRAQVANDPSKATHNTEWMQKQADKGWLSLPKEGTYYINDTIKFPAKIGGRITTRGYGVGYWYPGDHPSKLSNQQTRICQLADNKPALRLRGTGVVCYSPLVIEGRGNAAAIEVEGRNTPIASGRHRFANLSFYNWTHAFKALGGYYKDDGTLIKDENHADNTSVTDCEYCNCGILVSDNEQAVNWYFRGALVGFFGTPQPVTLFDIKRGGKQHIDGLEICHPKVTIFKVRDYSPNNCWLTCRDLSFDRQPYPGVYLTLFEYAGDPTAASWSRWVLDIDGFVAQKFTDEQLYKVPATLPRDKWKINLETIYTK